MPGLTWLRTAQVTIQVRLSLPEGVPVREGKEKEREKALSPPILAHLFNSREGEKTGRTSVRNPGKYIP
jgi:hypothetical protein